MCDLVRYVTFTTNLTLLRENKTNSTLPRSLMATLMAFLLLLLFGLLSAESPENCLSLIFILPELHYGNVFSNITLYVINIFFISISL